MKLQGKIEKLAKGGLFKDVFIYGLTNSLFTGLPLILMPFLVAVMSPEDYGIVELFRSISLVLIPIIGFSTVQSLTRFYFDLDRENFKEFTSSIILLHFFNSFVVIILLAIVSNFINDSKYSIIIFLAVIYFLFNQITEALLSIYRVERLSKKYMVIRLGSVFLDLIILFVFFKIYKNYDWTYRVYPNVISTALFGIVSLIIFWKVFGLRMKYNADLLKMSITYSFPLIFHMISGYILNIGDRFFINSFLGTKELGNYSVAYQVGMAISFFYTSFNLAWLPTFFDLIKSKNFKKIAQIRNVVFVALPILAFFILFIWVMVSNYIPNFKNFNVDFKLVVIITVSYIFLSYYKFNANYYFYSKNTKKLATITTLTAILCLLGYFLFIPKYGLIGAAVTTLITFVIMYICVFNAKQSLKDEENN